MWQQVLEASEFMAGRRAVAVAGARELAELLSKQRGASASQRSSGLSRYPVDSFRDLSSLDLPRNRFFRSWDFDVLPKVLGHLFGPRVKSCLQSDWG